VLAVCCHPLLLCVLLQVCVVLLLALLLAGLFAWRGVLRCLLSPPAQASTHMCRYSASLLQATQVTTHCLMAMTCSDVHDNELRRCYMRWVMQALLALLLSAHKTKNASHKQHLPASTAPAWSSSLPAPTMLTWLCAFGVCSLPS
jgi:hypothetical protein